jgi:hypothetical protein
MDTPDTEDSPPPSVIQRIFGTIMEGVFIVTFGWIGLLIAMASGDFEWMSAFPRFWLSTLGSAALGTLVCWLVASPTIGWWLFSAFVVPGLIVGIWWERRSKR